MVILINVFLYYLLALYNKLRYNGVIGIRFIIISLINILQVLYTHYSFLELYFFYIIILYK